VEHYAVRVSLRELSSGPTDNSSLLKSVVGLVFPRPLKEVKMQAYARRRLAQRIVLRPVVDPTLSSFTRPSVWALVWAHASHGKDRLGVSWLVFQVLS
jgi:hypothetical protein